MQPEDSDRTTADALAAVTPSTSFAAGLEASRSLARRCASTGWLAAALNEGALLARSLPESAGSAPVCVAHEPAGASIETIGDAASVTGKWTWIPDVGAQAWILAALPENCDGGYALVRAGEAREAGAAPGALPGVRFRTLDLTGYELPRRHLVRTADLPPAFVALAPLALVGAAMGCAEGAWDDYLRITRRRTAAIGGHAIASLRHVQVRVGDCAAVLASLARTFDDLVAATAARERDPAALVDHDVAAIERDAARIAHEALALVTRVVRQMGAFGLAEANPVQGRYRDMRVIATDRRLAYERLMAGYGRAELLGAAAAG